MMIVKIFGPIEGILGSPDKHHISQGYLVLRMVSKLPFSFGVLAGMTIFMACESLWVATALFAACAIGMAWFYLSVRRYAHAIIREGKG